MAKVAVTFGGPSSEAEISRRTAKSVVEHLPEAGYDPVPVEVLPDRRFRFGSGEPLPPEQGLGRLRAMGVVAVFPGFHGPFGEDGKFQGFLEVAGFPYVGSGVTASALAMDKVRTREVLAAHGVRSPEALDFTGASPQEAGADVLRRFSLPVVVKTPAGGSSYEVRIVKTQADLARELERRLTRAGGRALVEEHIAGTELTCAVLGNASVGETPRALPVVRIVLLDSETFDEVAKYDPDAVIEECPAQVDDSLALRVTQISELAHHVLRCDGLTRSDFLVGPDGEPRFLEINTLPGLTAESIAPKAARAAGMSFAGLLRRLVTMALSRHRLRTACPEPPTEDSSR